MAPESLQDLIRRSASQRPVNPPSSLQTLRGSSPPPMDEDEDLPPVGGTGGIFDMRPPPSSAVLSASDMSLLKVFAERALTTVKLQPETAAEFRRIVEVKFLHFGFWWQQLTASLDCEPRSARHSLSVAGPRGQGASHQDPCGAREDLGA